MVHSGCWVLVMAVVSVYCVYGPSILHVKVIPLPQLHLSQNVMRWWQFVKLLLSGVCEQAYCEELQSSSCLFSTMSAQKPPHTSDLAAVLLLPLFLTQQSRIQSSSPERLQSSNLGGQRSLLGTQTLFIQHLLQSQCPRRLSGSQVFVT